MKHRMGIAGQAGLGTPSKVLLDNKGKLTENIKKMIADAFALYPQLDGYADYHIEKFQIVFGREPSYQFEPLFIICLEETKGLSYLQTGKSFGDYGSGIRQTYKFYKDFKYKSKFIKFIDKWHKVLFK